jgi:hypothetical protein
VTSNSKEEYSEDFCPNYVKNLVSVWRMYEKGEWHWGSEKGGQVDISAMLATEGEESTVSHAMRPKARSAGPTQRPAWLAEGERPGRCDFVCDGRAVPPAFSVPYRLSLKGAAQLRGDGISSCCYIVNVHNHPSWATSCMEAWLGTLGDPCLLSGNNVNHSFAYQYNNYKYSLR